MTNKTNCKSNGEFKILKEKNSVKMFIWTSDLRTASEDETEDRLKEAIKLKIKLKIKWRIKRVWSGGIKGLESDD